MPDKLPSALAWTIIRAMPDALPYPKYRVLVIAPTSFFRDTGCHVRILEEARILSRLGHRVDIATYRNGDDVEGLNIHRTLPIPWRQHYEVGSSRHKFAFDLLLGLTVLWLLLTRKFDVIHGHLHEGGLIGIVLGGLRGVPVLCDLQGSLTEEMIDHGFITRDQWLYKPFLWLEKWIVRRSGRVVASTPQFAELLTREFGARPERVCVLSDFVDTAVFRPRTAAAQPRIKALRRCWQVPRDAPVIVYLGLLAPYQGTDLLLEAMPRVLAQIPEARLLLMGYPFMAEYKAKAERLGVGHAVTVTGRISYADVPACLSLGCLAVAPKLSRTEGLGKLLHYMAMGLPTVAFDVPVARSYMADLGLYAQAGNAASLAQEIVKALRLAVEQPAAFGQRQAQLRQRAQEHFAWQPVGAVLNELYTALQPQCSRQRKDA